MKTAIEFIKEWLDIPFHKDREKSGNIDISTLALMDMMDKFANQSKWIDVNERLPTEKDANKFGKVLVLYGDGSCNAQNFNIVGKISQSNWHTHWQPLPKNPTE